MWSCIYHIETQRPIPMHSTTGAYCQQSIMVVFFWTQTHPSFLYGRCVKRNRGTEEGKGDFCGILFHINYELVHPGERALYTAMEEHHHRNPISFHSGIPFRCYSFPVFLCIMWAILASMNLNILFLLSLVSGLIQL